MTDSAVWSVDHIAAKNLVASLGLDSGDDQIEAIAGHFARHRQDAYRWATERARSQIINRMESESMRLCQQSGHGWVEGFMRAEQVVMTMSDEDILNIRSGQSRSKGQILRAMMRRAKHS